MNGRGPCDLLLVIGDGLSAAAIERQAVPLVVEVLAQRPEGWTLGPLVVATQARVAWATTSAPAWARPGGHADRRAAGPQLARQPGHLPDPRPRVGRTDAERNCLSNVRPEGLPPAEAARKLWWLAEAARTLQLTGVGLKDRSDERALPGAG
jgi:ethanolamine ammonia-lyase small subunit